MIRTTQSGLNLLVPPKSLYPSNQGYAASKFWGENTRKCHIWIVKVSYSSHLFRNDHSAMKERSRKINCWEKKNLDTASENAHFWFLFRTKWVKFCCFVGPSACFGLMPSQTDVGGLITNQERGTGSPLWHHEGLQNCGSWRTFQRRKWRPVELSDWTETLSTLLAEQISH